MNEMKYLNTILGNLLCIIYYLEVIRDFVVFEIRKISI